LRQDDASIAIKIYWNGCLTSARIILRGYIAYQWVPVASAGIWQAFEPSALDYK
jgi:hypothetical protein